MVIAGQGALCPDGVKEIFLAGGERLYAIAFHVGASLLVLYGICMGKTVRYLLGAIALHTLLDAAIIILPSIFGVGQMGIWIYGALGGVLTLAAGIWVCRRLDSGKGVNCSSGTM